MGAPDSADDRSRTCPSCGRAVISIGIYGMGRDLRPSRFAYPCGHRVVADEVESPA